MVRGNYRGKGSKGGEEKEEGSSSSSEDDAMSEDQASTAEDVSTVAAPTAAAISPSSSASDEASPQSVGKRAAAGDGGASSAAAAGAACVFPRSTAKTARKPKAGAKDGGVRKEVKPEKKRKAEDDVVKDEKEVKDEKVKREGKRLKPDNLQLLDEIQLSVKSWKEADPQAVKAGGELEEGKARFADDDLLSGTVVNKGVKKTDGSAFIEVLPLYVVSPLPGKSLQHTVRSFVQEYNGHAITPKWAESIRRLLEFDSKLDRGFFAKMTKCTDANAAAGEGEGAEPGMQI